jgi:hypothetical protein
VNHGASIGRQYSPPQYLEKMRILKAALRVSAVSAVFGLAYMAITFPPLFFIAVPVSMVLLGMAVGI